MPTTSTSSPGSNRARRNMRSADDATSPAAAARSHESETGFGPHVPGGHDDALGVRAPTVFADDAEVTTERHIAVDARRACTARRRGIDHHLVAQPGVVDPVADRVDDPRAVGAAHVGNDGGAGMPRATQRSRWFRADARRARAPRRGRAQVVVHLGEHVRAGAVRVVQEPRLASRDGTFGQRRGPARRRALACPIIEELQAGLASILGSPRDEGRLEMVVRRPAEDEQEVLTEARIESGEGLVGDRGSTRGEALARGRGDADERAVRRRACGRGRPMATRRRPALRRRGPRARRTCRPGAGSASARWCSR